MIGDENRVYKQSDTVVAFNQIDMVKFYEIDVDNNSSDFLKNTYSDKFNIIKSRWFCYWTRMDT